MNLCGLRAVLLRLPPVLLCFLCVLLLKVFAEIRVIGGLSPWFPLSVLFGLVWCSLVLFGPKFIFAKNALVL